MFNHISTNIQDNLKRIQERIAQAALRSGRSPEDITLVAVSKKQGLDKILAAVEAGAKVLGENYVQEAQAKISALDRPVEWHLIGHLQKNKVRLAVPLFALIHTVDSLELAQLINDRAQLEGKTQRILLEINLAREGSKSGVFLEKALELAIQVNELPHLSLEGLMTMPPFLEDSNQVRPYFSKLRELLDQLNASLYPPLRHLSMGMSHDFEVAIEEGATLVRVGSAIFGPRE